MPSDAVRWALTTSAAFTLKAVAWPTAQPSGEGRPQTACDSTKGAQNSKLKYFVFQILSTFPLPVFKFEISVFFNDNIFTTTPVQIVKDLYITVLTCLIASHSNFERSKISPL